MGASGDSYIRELGEYHRQQYYYVDEIWVKILLFGSIPKAPFQSHHLKFNMPG